MKEVNKTKHIPVLFDEVLKGLALAPGKMVVDATLGGGGHARAILQEVLSGGKVIAIDTDEQALDRFKKRANEDVILGDALRDGKMILIKRNYSAIDEVLEEQGISNVDAILADLGFSSDQIESAERGMSFQEDGPLDMRLDQSSGKTAVDLVNDSTESELTQILREYGEEREARRISKAIVLERAKERIMTTGQLRTLIENVYPKKLRYAQKIHPATKTFQALRIVVNKELEHLEEFLKKSVQVLAPGGRLAVITFHSGEDRIVKNFFKEQAQGCVCPPEFPICQCGNKAIVKILTKKPVRASDGEESQNPRARSAKLRVVEKIK